MIRMKKITTPQQLSLAQLTDLIIPKAIQDFLFWVGRQERLPFVSQSLYCVNIIGLASQRGLHMLRAL